MQFINRDTDNGPSVVLLDAEVQGRRTVYREVHNGTRDVGAALKGVFTASTKFPFHDGGR